MSPAASNNPSNSAQNLPQSIHGTDLKILQNQVGNPLRDAQDRLQAAIAHLGSDGEGSGRAQEQKAALVEWAKSEGVLIDRFPFKLDGPRDKGGAEHHVFGDPANKRWIKLTRGTGEGMGNFLSPKSKTWGITRGTPRQYLQSIADRNALIGDDTQVHAVFQDKHGNVGIVTSQPDMQGASMETDEISAVMQADEFLPLGDSAYYRSSDNTLVLDLNDTNTVRSAAGPMLIYDASVIHPTAAELAQLGIKAASQPLLSPSAAPLRPITPENAFGEWGASLKEDGILYGYRGENGNGQADNNFGSSEGIGLYLAKTEEDTAFFGKARMVNFPQPKRPIIVDEDGGIETIPLLNEEAEAQWNRIFSHQTRPGDSDWMKAHILAAKRIGLTEDTWLEKIDAYPRALTDKLLTMGYDAVYVRSGGMEWVNLLAKPGQRFNRGTRSAGGTALYSPAASNPTALAKSLFDSIGEQALRVEQPGKSYEDKRQLILDFSKSVIPTGPESTPDVRQARVQTIRTLRQRVANTVAVDLKVRFIGDVIPDTETRVEKAQALRTAVKGDGTKKGGRGWPPAPEPACRGRLANGLPPTLWLSADSGRCCLRIRQRHIRPQDRLDPLHRAGAFARPRRHIAQAFPSPQQAHHVGVFRQQLLCWHGGPHRPPEPPAAPSGGLQARDNPLAQGFPLRQRHLGKDRQHHPGGRVALATVEHGLDPLAVPVERNLQI
jgi:hypothetical protein